MSQLDKSEPGSAVLAQRDIVQLHPSDGSKASKNPSHLNERSRLYIDVAGNRRARKWSITVQLARVAWAIGKILFALSPRPFWAWRRLLLRAFGARIGKSVHLHPTVRIAMPWNIAIGDESSVGDRAILYSLGQIRIGSNVTISQYAHLCAGTHDYRLADFPLVKAPIVIGDGAWICADAFVGPHVTVGARSIVGARAVVMKDVAPGVIVSGNPARCIGVRPELTC